MSCAKDRVELAKQITRIANLTRAELCRELGYAGTATNPLKDWEGSDKPSFRGRLRAYLEDSNFLPQLTALSRVFPDLAGSPSSDDEKPVHVPARAKGRIESSDDEEPVRVRMPARATPVFKPVRAPIPVRSPTPLVPPVRLPTPLVSIPRLPTPTPVVPVVPTPTPVVPTPVVPTPVVPTAVRVTPVVNVPSEPAAVACGWCKDPRVRVKYRGPAKQMLCQSCALQYVTRSGSYFSKFSRSEECYETVNVESTGILDIGDLLSISGLSAFLLCIGTDAELSALSNPKLADVPRARVDPQLNGVTQDPVFCQLVQPANGLPLYVAFKSGKLIEEFYVSDVKLDSDSDVKLEEWQLIVAQSLSEEPVPDPLDYISEEEWKTMGAELSALHDTELDDLLISEAALIGKGGYGSVIPGRFKAEWAKKLGQPTSQEFNKAFKRTVLRRNDIEYEKTRALFTSILREVAGYALMAPSGTVPPLEGVCVRVKPESEEIETFLIMPKCQGTLRHFIQARSDNTQGRSGSIQNHEQISIALTICDGLAWMHNREYVHRDIKPDNILIPVFPGIESQVFLQSWLADFGIARKLDGPQSGFSCQHADESRWLDPATFFGKSRESASDVYAFGNVLYFIATRQQPWQKINSSIRNWTEFVKDKHQEGKQPGEPPVGHFLADVMKACWAPQERRPSIQEINSVLQKIALEQFPTIKRQYNTKLLHNFCRNRVATSVTPYPFHHKKSSLLKEHRRMMEIIGENAESHFEKFFPEQLEILATAVRAEKFINAISDEDFQRLQPGNCNLRSRRCLYIYQNKRTRNGYVGISKAACQTRDKGHRDGRQEFDLEYQKAPADWNLIVFYSAETDEEYESFVATRLEPLLILLLNTYATRGSSMGFNVEPGAKKTYARYLDLLHDR